MSAIPSTSPAISEEAVARFADDGFLLVEDFFKQEELDRFAPLVDAAVEYRTSDGETSRLWQARSCLRGTLEVFDSYPLGKRQNRLNL